LPHRPDQDRPKRILFKLSFTILSVFFSLVIPPIALASEITAQPNIRDQKLTVQVVFEGLNFPTSMAFLGPDDILVLEKNEGTVKRIVNGEMLTEPLLKVDVSTISERGMLGIAIAEDETSHPFPYVFLYYTRPSASLNSSIDNMDLPASNYLYRYELINNKLENPELLLHLPSLNEIAHNGGVLLIGPDENLYVSTGSVAADNPKSESDKTKPLNIHNGPDPDGRGGILRLSQDGKAVLEKGEGHTLSNEYPLNLYYAYGIRNSFGMDFDPESEFLWDTENGATRMDEINLVLPGFNSGWRQVMGLSALNKEFDPDELVDFDGRGEYYDPEFVFRHSVGLTSLKFLDSNKYGQEYQNDMFVSDFHNGIIYSFSLSKDRTQLELEGELQDKTADNLDELQDVVFGEKFGGITDMEIGPDGYLYVLSLHQGGNNCSAEEMASLGNCVAYDSDLQGKIFRITPKVDQE
jgi:glucose/arabinose dehydrogenase